WWWRWRDLVRGPARHLILCGFRVLAGGRQWREPQSFQTQTDARKAGENRTNPILAQKVVKSQHGGTGIDSYHIAANPVLIDIQVAETITALSIQAPVEPRFAEVFQNHGRHVGDGRQGGREVGSTVDGPMGCVTTVNVGGRGSAGTVAGGQAPKSPVC